MKIGHVRLFERRVIGGEEHPYLIRHILFRCESFGIYIHKFLRSDYERALHDHPWPFIAILLSGGYWEVHDQTISRQEESHWRERWSILLRPAEWRHRIVLNRNWEDTAYQPVWTLVLVGRKTRKWGFFIPHVGWCYWRKYNYKLGICEDEIIWQDGGD